MTVKGILLGAVLFVIFLLVWYPRFIASMGIPRGTQYAIAPSVILLNRQFLIGLLVSFAVGVLLMRLRWSVHVQM
jgi:hypothetical protein